MTNTLDPWSSEDGAERASALFRRRFDARAQVVTSAPGRVNLIGEHTDYNEGLCLPIALPHATYAAACARDDGVVRLVSGDGPVWEGSLDDLRTSQGWAAYAGGVVWALGEQGHRIGGIDLAIESCVPVGAGLSSSAALECSTGLAVLALLGVPDDAAMRRALADAGIRAENEVAGASTGGMDQTIAVAAEEGSALLLDCRTWQSELVPFDPSGAGLELLVVDTRVHHALNDGGYAARRTDCETAATALGLESLRDASLDDLSRIHDERVRRRATHVVTEIDRVAETVAALRADEWEAVGALMRESHASMRDDFEISCPELDAVVETVIAHGAPGARMTGGGFGGSAIALVPAHRADRVRAEVDAVFAGRGWEAPAYLPGRASGAARVLS